VAAVHDSQVVMVIAGPRAIAWRPGNIAAVDWRQKVWTRAPIRWRR
jgi:hypothetical protein